MTPTKEKRSKKVSKPESFFFFGWPSSCIVVAELSTTDHGQLRPQLLRTSKRTNPIDGPAASEAHFQSIDRLLKTRPMCVWAIWVSCGYVRSSVG